MTDPDLSIIVPAYNEEKRLAPTLDTILRWLDERDLSGEILAVDDGSSDGTVELIRRYVERDPRVILVENGVNRGKGFAVRNGVRHSQGALVLFSDADLSTPIEDYDKLLVALQDADVAVGSRALARSDVRKRQPWYRQNMGRAFNLMVQLATLPGIKDTQCGFKLFRGEVAREVFGRQRIDGFAFDVEILFIARRLGYRIAEVPVVWINDEASRVSPIRHSAQMARDILRIRWMHRHLGRRGF